MTATRPVSAPPNGTITREAVDKLQTFDAAAGRQPHKDQIAEMALVRSDRQAPLVDRCVEVLVALVDAHNGAGQLASATRVARELVDLDPYDERSHRLLMTALARTGRRGQALRQYLVCRRMLLDHLGVEPGEDTSALYAHVLAGDVI